MLSYDEALARALALIPGPLAAEVVPLSAAWGRALAGDVYADEPLPPFDNSAVDGYAVRLADVPNASPSTPQPLRVTQTIAAGYAPTRPVGPGEAARILTGAPLPPGADALIMVEDTETKGDTVLLRDAPSARFIRRAGSDLPKGALALQAGSTIDAGTMGLLAALNSAHVSCARRPRVAVITTGDEVVPPGGLPLAPGQIRDANGPALEAAVIEAGAVVVIRLHVPDDLQATQNAFHAAAFYDLVISCGGVSVGEFDFVKAAVEAEGGSLDFWRVAIKPGKPLCFGKIRDALFFGLPGNPASSLVTFELFARPVLRKMAGYADLSRPRLLVQLATDLPHEPGRREFVRARLEFGNAIPTATPTGAQTSHRLASMAGADALLIAEEDRGDYQSGERIPALLLKG